MRFDLSDEEWTIIEPLLPPRIRGPKRVDDRKILNGIFDICARVPLGVTCLSVTARAQRFTTAIPAGHGAGFGVIYLRLWPKMAKTVCCLLRGLSLKCTARQPAQKGGIGAG